MQTEAPTSLPQQVDAHVKCVRCGYDLFGASADGACSECGAAVADTLRAGAWLRSPERRRLVRRGAGLLLGSAFTSGLCVLFAFLFFVAINSSRLDVGLPGVVWALFAASVVATLLLAMKGTRRIMEGVADEAPVRRFHRALGLDIAAAAGLSLLVVAGLLVLADRDVVWIAAAAFGWLGFALLGFTTVRFHFAYGAIAELLRPLRRMGLAKGAVALGVFKMVYEGLWLGACMALGPLLGFIGLGEVGITLLFGGLFGVFGFAIVWIAMLVFHGMFCRAVDRCAAGSEPLQ